MVLLLILWKMYIWLLRCPLTCLYGTDGWDIDRLAALVSAEDMIGVTVPTNPPSLRGA